MAAPRLVVVPDRSGGALPRGPAQGGWGAPYMRRIGSSFRGCVEAACLGVDVDLLAAALLCLLALVVNPFIDLG